MYIFCPIKILEKILRTVKENGPESCTLSTPPSPPPHNIDFHQC